MQKSYTFDLCGRSVTLPVLELPSGSGIAFFNLHGDVELTEFCADRLARLVSGADVLITAESKGLQLCHCVARSLRHGFYAVARKTKKLYMQDGIQTTVESITTGQPQTLYLSAHDAALMRGKRVALIDDVISTGGSLLGLERLVAASGGTVFKKAAVLAEGAAAARRDIEFLAAIPLF
ncbi:MAG: adenine phosphoribosyltransferase [Clostridiales bacterium]|jgi:adenine phosphoribosyltransferase|nr:adenine phosphoribosyltransferase [Clostridiales bacterium]